MPDPDSDDTIPTEVWAIPLDDVDDLPRLAALVANLATPPPPTTTPVDGVNTANGERLR